MQSPTQPRADDVVPDVMGAELTEALRLSPSQCQGYFGTVTGAATEAVDGAVAVGRVEAAAGEVAASAG